jgi:superfamily I DNA/RNA helicase
MKKAYDQNNKLVDIIESVSTSTYTCPVCKETLERKFGAINQYYAHPKGKGDDCEIKMKLMLKNNIEFQQSEIDILANEFYNKQFDNVSIEMSDYKSEEGYYLTHEQKDVIFSKEDRIKVSALTGSSKSTTLYYYAKEHPFSKILYLVYNKSMQLESQELFKSQKHVEIRTIHSLAYFYCGKFYKDKLTFNYGVVDIIKDLNLNWNRDMELAVKINAMMTRYSLSSAQDFSDLEIFKDDDMRDRILSCCARLWELKKKYKNSIKITHDDYLKMFSLSKTDLSSKYDIILLDECQDSSMMMFDILKNSNVKIIVTVGDPYQAIYGWRQSVNIMPLFDAKEYKLTTSFRVSQNIAHIENLIISDFIGDDIKMKGFNSKQTIVDKIDKSKPYACLCRTNAYIFAEIAETLSEDKDKKFFFVGNFSSYSFESLKQCYYFSQGYPTKNKLFAKFEDYSTMKTYAEDIEDIEILSLIRMVDKYGSKIIDIVDGIKNNTVTDKNKADIIFSTCHKAKGLTIDIPVYISNDYLDLEVAYRNKYLKKDEYYGDKKKVEKDISEEIFIIYVAISRCKGAIVLNDSIKRYLLMRFNHVGHKLHNVNNKEENI